MSEGITRDQIERLVREQRQLKEDVQKKEVVLNVNPVDSNEQEFVKAPKDRYIKHRHRKSQKGNRKR